ncbi:tropomodulin-like isoform X1 [Haliotis cracherodii]|uniref:tropomodulin-like isoform X2 n=1 Tax=Haliotis rufescens TaxID=6454 RepID=UPI001EB06F22|nr:tropomodulin-like isoform X2 [Haliotis rufescens]
MADLTSAMSAILHKDKDKEVPDIELEDLDDLLTQLTTEELEELNGDFDPDNSLLPPGLRCRDQTSKEPTGPFNRQKLLKFIENQAKQEKDWEQNKSYVKETRGKVFKKKEEEKPKKSNDDGDFNIDTEWDDILTEASEEELVDLAAVLGFHSMLTQTQYYASLQDEKISEGGFTGHARAQQFKAVPDEPLNDTDIEKSIEQLKSNDAKLIHLNLNNIKNLSIEQLLNVCEALKTNNTLKIFEMAGVAATDKVAKKLAEALSENKTLRTVNVESNYISGECLVGLMRAINTNQVVTELRVANQKPELLGNQVEMNLLKLILANNTLLRFGLTFEFPDPRFRVIDKLKTNYDALRKKRAGKE